MSFKNTYVREYDAPFPLPYHQEPDQMQPLQISIAISTHPYRWHYQPGAVPSPYGFPQTVQVLAQS